MLRSLAFCTTLILLGACAPSPGAPQTLRFGVMGRAGDPRPAAADSLDRRAREAAHRLRLDRLDVRVAASRVVRQYARTIPDELLEAARVDGAGEVRIFVTIVVPLLRPVLASLAMMAGSVVTVLPVLALFLALQKHYIRGLLLGSVKG